MLQVTVVWIASHAPMTVLVTYPGFSVIPVRLQVARWAFGG